MPVRVFFLCIFFFCGLFRESQLQAIEQGTQVSAQSPNLQAGDYVWQPQISPDGPVVIVVDLNQQLLQVYRNGVEIGRSSISSGRDHHATPSGIFTILQKKVTHHSNVYHEASMPYMERLTWGGVAIHAGNNPGHPDSHGCVHVPLAFAKKLYTVTDKGTTVLVTQGADPSSAPKAPDLVFSKAKGDAPLPPLAARTPQFSWNPQASPSGPVCIVYSSADRRIYINRGGVEIGRAATPGAPAGQPVGDRVYAALAQTSPDGFHDWKLLGSLDESPAPNGSDVLRQLALPAPFLADLQQTVTPGTTLVITDERVNGGQPQSQGGDILDTANN